MSSRAAPPTPNAPEAARTARGMFMLAWGFLVMAAALGLLLRLLALHPLPQFTYGFWLHAHSHVAFLGWIYNAFFALALHAFVPPEHTRSYRRLFFVTQVATLGMLATFPWQGYARESIVFSTLHLGCSGVFAWRLLRRNRASPLARRYLAGAFGCLFASALGPLALGPLAAAGWRDTPWYPLAIYVYLHFQYNGWFVLFLLAVFCERAAARGLSTVVRAGERALPWLAIGAVLTVALSALWMSPPGWVFVTAAAGGLAQLVGAAHLLAGFRRARPVFGSAEAGAARAIAAVAAASLLGKYVLQAVAAVPALGDLANQRPVVLAFLHLVFLGVATPMLLAWALEFGWLRRTRSVTVGLLMLGLGVAASELALVLPPIGAVAGVPVAFASGETLAGAAALMFLGAGLVLVARGGWRGPETAR